MASHGKSNGFWASCSAERVSDKFEVGLAGNRERWQRRIQADSQAGSQADSQAGRLAGWQTARQAGRQAGSIAGRKQDGREASRQAAKQYPRRSRPHSCLGSYGVILRLQGP